MPRAYRGDTQDRGEARWTGAHVAAIAGGVGMPPKGRRTGGYDRLHGYPLSSVVVGYLSRKLGQSVMVARARVRSTRPPGDYRYRSKRLAENPRMNRRTSVTTWRTAKSNV